MLFDVALCGIFPRSAVVTALALLSKEDPSDYFAEPVDASLLPGYRDVVSHISLGPMFVGRRDAAVRFVGNVTVFQWRYRGRLRHDGCPKGYGVSLAGVGDRRGWICKAGG